MYNRYIRNDNGIYSRIPEEEGEDGLPVMWNWSWRGFWAALTRQPLVQEAADASRL